MRLIYFSPGYTTHDYRFLKAISDAGHEAFFVQLEGNLRQVEDRPVPKNVHQVQWKGGHEPFRWSKLLGLTLDFKRLVRQIKPDLIHAGPIQTCAFIAILSGFRPVLTMSWGFDLMENVNESKWMEWVTRYTLKRSSFFTSDANATRDIAIKYGVNPQKTVVFPWGVDLDQFKPYPDHWLMNKGHFTLFCNRSWETRYGVDVLARAFVKVARQSENADLILLSDGSLSNHIRHIFQVGGVTDRVTFGGQISQTDLPRWYQTADLYISPSHIDGSSVSLMEALACGLPCLVSDIPANKEWVIEHENGWLFRDGDENDLVGKILTAIAQKEKLAEIGRAGRKSAEMRADWKKNAEVLMNVYRSLGEKNVK